jgi:outer membrane protein OmpA-like peptidoglycan-associated protein
MNINRRTRKPHKQETATPFPPVQDDTLQVGPAVPQQTMHEVPPIVQEVLSSSGQPLDTNTQAFMESRFGHDFSQVRVHTDQRAVESAQEVNALAYTVGKDIVFGEGQHAPRKSEGKSLLAHELTHVVQQESASIPDAAVEAFPVSTASDTSEQAAHNVANTMTLDHHASHLTLNGSLSTKLTRPSIQRQEEGPPATPGLQLQQPSLIKEEREEGPATISGLQLQPPTLAKGQSIEAYTIDSFKLGKTDLTPQHKFVLTMIAERIVAQLAIRSDVYISIVGHTDTTGSDEVNEMVGQGRADQVKAFLATKKVPEHIMLASNKGPSELVVKTGKNVPEKCNRRVEIFIKELPKSPPSPPPSELAKLLPKLPSLPPLETDAERVQRQLKEHVEELKAKKQPQKQGASMKDVLNQAIDKLLDPVMEGLKIPREYRSKIRDAVHDGVEKGIESLADTLLDQEKVDESGKAAIRNIIKGAMQLKHQGEPNL